MKYSTLNNLHRIIREKEDSGVMPIPFVKFV